MKKRMLSMLLAVLMVLTVLAPLALTAQADTKLLGVSVWYNEPKIGMAPQDVVINGGGFFSDFNVSKIFSTTIGHRLSILKDDTTFGVGRYQMTITLTPKAGGYFEEGFTVNISNTYKPTSRDINVDVENQKVTIKTVYDFTNTVSYVQVGGNQVPEAGKKADSSYPYALDKNGNAIHSDSAVVPMVKMDSFWYKGESTGSGIPFANFLSKTSVFEKGQTYTFRFSFVCRESYSFAETVTFTHATQDASTMHVYYVEETQRYNVDLTYKLPDPDTDKRLYSCSYAFTIPVLGNTLSMPTLNNLYNAAKDFDCEETWTKKSNNEMGIALVLKNGAVFSEGTYHVKLVLTPKAGSYFYKDIDVRNYNLYTPAGGYTVKTADNYISIEADFELSSKIGTVKLGTSQTPIASHTADMTYPYAMDENGNNISADSAIMSKVRIEEDKSFWYEGVSSQVPGAALAKTDKFQVGKRYTYRFYVSAREGYTFAEDVQFLYNTSEYVKITAYPAGEKNAYLVDATFDYLNVLKVIEIKDVVAPVIGAPATGTGVAANPKKYDLTGTPVWLLWKGPDDVEELPSGAKFEEGKQYALRVRLEIKDGSSIAADGLNYILTDKDGNDIDFYATDRVNLEILYIMNPLTKPAEPPAVKLGDVDKDGEITAADARLALRRAVDLEKYAPGSDEFIACNVDKDAEVTAADARMILRAAVELEDPTTW